MTLHFSHMGFTEDLTFMSILLSRAKTAIYIANIPRSCPSLWVIRECRAQRYS